MSHFLNGYRCSSALCSNHDGGRCRCVFETKQINNFKTNYHFHTGQFQTTTIGEQFLLLFLL